MEEVKKKRLIKDVTVTHVSYVKRGANKKQFFLAKNDCERADVEFDVKFFGKFDDDEKKLLYGVVYEPNVEDAHGDFMTADEIEKTAHEFLQYYRNIDTEHNLMAGAGVVVESYITPISMNIGGNEIKAGSWVLVTKADDDIWDSWKAGEITGYSMFGISRTTQMCKGETKVNKWVKKFLESLGLSKSFDETMEQTFDSMSRNPFFILDIMQEDFFNSISWDSLPEEQLGALSKAMKSAATYIDGKISTTFMKSEDENPDAKEDSSDKEPDTKDVAVKDTNTSEEQETDNPVPEAEDKKDEDAETEDNPEDSPIFKALKLSNDAVLETIKQIKEDFDSKLSKLEKSIADTASKIDERNTESAAIIPRETIFNQSKPRGNGLI